MTAVLIVLSLLVFAAGLVAWAVHMVGVWTREASWAARRRVSPARALTAATAADAEADNPLPPIAESPASTDDAVLKEARP